MAQSQLAQFLESAAGKPYRELVQYHLKRQSTSQIQNAVMGETLLLPENLRPFVTGYVDVVNARLGYDKQFWNTATCRVAFEAIMEIAVEVFPLNGIIGCVEDALKPENHPLAFQLFQIPTLSLAYSASTQRAQRRFMGIRKGFFG